jgi:hypothetical protein
MKEHMAVFQKIFGRVPEYLEGTNIRCEFDTIFRPD